MRECEPRVTHDEEAAEDDEEDECQVEKDDGVRQYSVAHRPVILPVRGHMNSRKERP